MCMCVWVALAYMVMGGCRWLYATTRSVGVKYRKHEPCLDQPKRRAAKRSRGHQRTSFVLRLSVLQSAAACVCFPSRPPAQRQQLTIVRKNPTDLHTEPTLCTLGTCCSGMLGHARERDRERETKREKKREMKSIRRHWVEENGCFSQPHPRQHNHPLLHPPPHI